MKAALQRFSVSVAGLSSESVALILAVGLVLGVFPVFGCPTLLCAMAAVVLRINLPAIQVVNQLTSPLQLALLVPLARVGARIMGGTAAWSLAGAARDAVIAWFCLCVPLGLVFYVVLLFTLRRCRRGCFNGLENPV